MVFVKRQINSIENEGIEIRKFFLLSRTSPRLVIQEGVRLAEDIKKFKPDIVHAQYGTMTGFLCSFFWGHRFVITFRGSDINFIKGINSARSLVGKILSNISIWRADAVICVSENLKKSLWWGQEKTVVIPNGVNIDTFCPIPKDEARKYLGLDQFSKLILFNAGGYRAVKRMDLAEQALKHVKKYVPNAELLILDGNIPADNVYLYHNAADCLLVVSDSEGSPNIVKEAMACNLPVVSVDVGDVRERLEGVTPSCIVDRDPSKIADAVVPILLSSERSNGLQKIKDLSEASVASAIIRLYERLDVLCSRG